MSEASLLGAKVRLTAPDGQTFDFLVDDLIPYAGDTYVVLRAEKEDEQLLITHLETDADGAPVFVVATEEDIIDNVMEKRLLKTVRASLNHGAAHGGCGTHDECDKPSCGCGAHDECDEPSCGCGAHDECDEPSCGCGTHDECDKPSCGCGAHDECDEPSCGCGTHDECDKPSCGCGAHDECDKPSCGCGTHDEK